MPENESHFLNFSRVRLSPVSWPDPPENYIVIDITLSQLATKIEVRIWMIIIMPLHLHRSSLPQSTKRLVY